MLSSRHHALSLSHRRAYLSPPDLTCTIPGLSVRLTLNDPAAPCECGEKSVFDLCLFPHDVFPPPRPGPPPGSAVRSAGVLVASVKVAGYTVDTFGPNEEDSFKQGVAQVSGTTKDAVTINGVADVAAGSGASGAAAGRHLLRRGLLAGNTTVVSIPAGPAIAVNFSVATGDLARSDSMIRARAPPAIRPTHTNTRERSPKPSSL